MSANAVLVVPDQDRRRLILEAATRHFGAQSYDQVSTVAIAADAGVNRGWIHHEFGSKRDLYLAVLQEVITIPVLPELPALMAKPDGFRAALQEAIESWLDHVAANREAYLAAHRVTFGLASDPEIMKLVGAVRERAIDLALAALSPDPAAAPKASRAVVACLGAMAGQALAEWLSFDRLTREQVVDVLVRANLAMHDYQLDLLGANAVEH